MLNRMEKNENIEGALVITDNIPVHVAIIMDGNGRWAQSRGLDRTQGHVAGVSTVRNITEEASRLGIKYLTLYTFSTENWNRPEVEVNTLMQLIVTAIEQETSALIKNNIRLSMIGDIARMPRFAVERLEQCVHDTSKCTGLNLILAISYSSRWEITKACREIAAKVAAGELLPEDVDNDTVDNNLCTHGLPDPDLLIRTGGDFRVSNFLLWQIAYSEIIVSPTYWPAYSREEFVKDIAEYQHRQRRFGLTEEQLRN